MIIHEVEVGRDVSGGVCVEACSVDAGGGGGGGRRELGWRGAGRGRGGGAGGETWPTRNVVAWRVCGWEES